MAESLTNRYAQIENAIGEINDVVTRIDERLDIFIEKLNSVEKKIENHIENCPVKCAFADVIGRISVLESKNGNSLKQEVREQLRDHADRTQCEITEVKRGIDTIRKEIETIKLDAKELGFVSHSSAGRWKIIGAFTLQVLAPLVYVIIGALIFRYFSLQAPSVNP